MLIEDMLIAACLAQYKLKKPLLFATAIIIVEIQGNFWRGYIFILTE
jgi:hypothetical protein